MNRQRALSLGRGNASSCPRACEKVLTRRQPNGHRDPTGVIGISALCRLPDHSYVVGSTSLPPGHNTGATDFLTEVEERFRPPAPSLHQTLAQVRGSNRRGRRNRRLWVAAALVGVVTITYKAALHQPTHASGSQIWKSGIQACDYIHR